MLEHQFCNVLITLIIKNKCYYSFVFYMIILSFKYFVVNIRRVGFLSSNYFYISKCLDYLLVLYKPSCNKANSSLMSITQLLSSAYHLHSSLVRFKCCSYSDSHSFFTLQLLICKILFLNF